MLKVGYVITLLLNRVLVTKCEHFWSYILTWLDVCFVNVFASYIFTWSDACLMNVSIIVACEF